MPQTPKRIGFFYWYSLKTPKKKSGGVSPPRERAKRARYRDPPSGSLPSNASEFAPSPFHAPERGSERSEWTPSPADEQSEEKGEGATRTHNHALCVPTTVYFHSILLLFYFLPSNKPFLLNFVMWPGFVFCLYSFCCHVFFLVSKGGI